MHICCHCLLSDLDSEIGKHVVFSLGDSVGKDLLTDRKKLTHTS